MNKRRIMEIIKKDCTFFIQNNIIDYSLLIGVNNKSDTSHKGSGKNTPVTLPNEPSPFQTLNNSVASITDEKFYQINEGGLLSSDKKQIYFFGIIDIFTEFNTKKRMENVYKSIAQNSQTISCVPPQRYAERFYHFMEQAFK